ncbi:MAG: type III pantothenate kinase [Bacteroidia bacterium]
MNLVIDLGNTRIKAGIFDGEELVHQVSYSGFTTEKLISDTNKHQIDYCIFSSVVKGLDIIDKLKNLFPLLVLDAHTKLPFINQYKTPGTLGNDRKANIAGAAKLFPGKHVLVIDAGTCLKTDFINSKSEYTGGSISPGLQMRFKAVNDYTSQLPLVNYRPMENFTGTGTEESILAGVIKGFLFEMEGFIDSYKSKYKDLKVILTGGDAALFDKTLKNSIFVAPYLALSGLNVILNYNVEKNKI